MRETISSIAFPSNTVKLDRRGCWSITAQFDVSQVTGRVDGTRALSPPVGAHGPFGEFTLLPGFAYYRATSPRQGAGSLIFDAVQYYAAINLICNFFQCDFFHHHHHHHHIHFRALFSSTEGWAF